MEPSPPGGEAYYYAARDIIHFYFSPAPPAKVVIISECATIMTIRIPLVQRWPFEGVTPRATASPTSCLSAKAPECRKMEGMISIRKLSDVFSDSIRLFYTAGI